MKKILIITADKCDDSEILYPYYRVIEAGFVPTIASFEKNTVNAKYHFSIMADISVEEIDTSEYDGLILPGGLAPEKLRQNRFVIEAVKSFEVDKKPIAAICHGQQILISAGILKNKNATCYPGIKDDLVNSGAIYEDKCVVVCDNLITSRRPEDLPFFMREFLKLLL
ncbi:MAG: type 1 glutamine amidotransferase [Clostridia bacterium]|nr:type 1 glutamine amidotransferase [Clostridia bacterium]